MKESTGKRVLSLGMSHSVFVTRLYTALKKHMPSLSINVLGELYPKIEEEERAAFSQIFPRKYQPAKVALYALLHFYWLLSPVILWNIGVAFVLYKGSIRETGKFIYELYKKRYLLRQQGQAGKMDMLHFHSMDQNVLHYQFALPRRKKIICSFWGSDLMRFGDPISYYFIRRFLQRADLITIQSVSLREILLSKYGRELAPKISICRFPLGNALFKALDQFEEKSVPKSKAQFTLMIGHNANLDNQQLQVIEALRQLPDHLLQQLRLLFPMTYGGDPENIIRVEEAVKALPCEAEIRTEYLAQAEMAQLYQEADVLIHVPISDALSATAVEAMYAGAHLITGTWLPYSPFRTSGLTYSEVEKVEDLEVVLPKLLADFAHLADVDRANQEKIKTHFSTEHIIKAWKEAYSQVL